MCSEPESIAWVGWQAGWPDVASCTVQGIFTVGGVETAQYRYFPAKTYAVVITSSVGFILTVAD